MKIVPNSLLNPTEKCIKVWNCSYIAVEGPNILGKISLEDIAIPYESQYRGRMVLNANATEQPLLFEGFLGTDVSFVMIKVTYDSENDPYYRYEKEKYAITYRYADETTTRPIGRLLILTGSDTNKVPQIYLNNPYGYKVTLDILMANLAQDDFTYTNLNETTFSNLYYNSVISNESFIFGIPVTGSSQLIVLNDSSLPVMYIPYSNIASTELDISVKTITLTTLNSESVVLKFLSDFDTYQAYSRIIWVQQSDGFASGAYRFMDEDYVYRSYEISTNNWITIKSSGADTIAPSITYNDTSGTTIPSVVALTFYHSTYTGWTSEQLKSRIISGITDNWDGEISFSDVNAIINKSASIPTLSAITTEGLYRIIFEVRDIANNLTSDSINNVYVDSTPPVITYNTGTVIGTGFTMSITGQTLSGTEITSVDIRDYIIDTVIDAVDSSVDKYDLVFTISDSGYEVSTITVDVDYLVELSVSDICGNETTKYLTLTATGAPDISSPVIIYNSVLDVSITGNTTTYSGFTGVTSGLTVDSGFTMYFTGITLTGITTSDVRDYVISGITDSGDPTIGINDVTINKINVNFVDTDIVDPGDYLIKLYIIDRDNNETTNYLILRAIDVTPPVITYNSVVGSSITGNTTTYSGFTGVTSGIVVSSGFTMSISGQSPTGITSAEIRDYIIDTVVDNVDTSVNKYSVIFNKIDNNGVDISTIITSGDYLIKLYVSDISGNETITYLILRAQN